MPGHQIGFQEGLCCEIWLKPDLLSSCEALIIAQLHWVLLAVAHTAKFMLIMSQCMQRPKCHWLAHYQAQMLHCLCLYPPLASSAPGSDAALALSECASG